MADFLPTQGGAALGGRLRRLSAAIDADAARIYAAYGIAFEQRWFGLLNQLVLRDSLSVGQLAEALGISHASVSETRRSLEGAGLIVSTTDPRDTRRRVLSLSCRGRQLAERLQPLWRAFDEAAREIDQEALDVTSALARLEDVLASRSLFDRVMDKGISL